MKKRILIYLSFTLCGYTCFSQNAKAQIDQQNNAANKANASKADVIIMKKMMMDSAQLVEFNHPADADKFKAVHKKKQKKLCNHKCKHH